MNEREHFSPRRKKQDKDPEDRNLAQLAAMKLLTRRSHSRKELERKLEQQGFSVACIAETLDHCANQRWLDDAAFAHHNAAALIRDGRHGPLAIITKLIQHGVSRPLAEKVLAEEGQGVDWTMRARSLLDKRLGKLDSLQEADRETRANVLASAQRFLLGRGFSHDTVRKVIWTEE